MFRNLSICVLLALSTAIRPCCAVFEYLDPSASGGNSHGLAASRGAISEADVFLAAHAAADARARALDTQQLLSGSIDGSKDRRPLSPAEFRVAMRKFVEESQRCTNWTGLSIAITRGEETLYEDGFGYLEPMSRRGRVDKNTLFHIGSATKAFTSLLASVAQEEELLRLDEPVAAASGNAVGFSDAVLEDRATLVDLLAHRTGYPRNDMLILSNASHVSDELIVDLVRQFKPVADFRVRMDYNNLMYTVAGWLTARAYGTTFGDLLQRKILSPLGMDSSTLDVAQAVRTRNYAPAFGYDAHGRLALIPASINRVFGHIAPAGALISSAVDMAKYLKMHIRGGHPVASSPATLATTYAPRTPLNVANSPKDRPFSFYTAGYALGWENQIYRGRRLIGHRGDTLGHHSKVSLVPELDVGIYVVVATPDSSRDATRDIVTFHAIDLLSRDVTWADQPGVLCGFPCSVFRSNPGCPENPFPQQPPLAPAPFLPRGVAAYLGTYENRAWGQFVVRRDRANSNHLVATYNSLVFALGFWKPRGDAGSELFLGRLTNAPWTTVFGADWNPSVVFNTDASTGSVVELVAVVLEGAAPPVFSRVAL